ncbi:MAG: LPS-assembly protein LptD [Spirochaetales bacterium]|nr:LPS-assembly protein LptD [Spirochaetales bacterium]
MPPLSRAREAPRRPSTKLSPLAASIIAVAVCVAPGSAAAQEVPVPDEAAAAVEAEGADGSEADATPASAPVERDLAEATLVMDLESSDLAALLARCRELGLPETGDEAELRARLYEHYGLEPPAGATGGGVSVRVLAADTARSYELDGERLTVLEGGVSLELEAEDGSVHRLFADSVVYNVELGMVYARGHVTYRTEGAEAFTGSALAIDLGSWSGRFLGGRTLRDASIGEADGLFFEADEIVRSTGDSASFRDGLITSCDLEDDPHWSIRASKVWLLAPGEWAIANAWLSVGEVPLLWLPFFYYPGEELVFHPVFGYRDREGRFVQTTTYLLGAKPPAKESTLPLSLAGDGSDGGKTLKGLFLRTDPDAEAERGSDYVKLIADAYGTLGAALALDWKLGELPLGGTGEGSLMLARSRSVFYTSGIYTPYVADGDWKSVWNDASFLGADLPLRFAFDSTLRFQGPGFSLSVRTPLASDPWVNRDFRDRSEDMDWLSFLDPAGETTPPAKLSALVQGIDLSWTPSPGALKPWLEGLSLSRFSSSLSWTARTRDQGVTEPYALYMADPLRDYFAPERLLLADAQVALRGTLLSVRPAARGAAPLPEGPALRVPWAPDAEAPDDAGASVAPDLGFPAGSGTEGVSDSAGAALVLKGFAPPAAAPGPASSKTSSTIATLGWTLAPAGSLERRFATLDLGGPADIVLEPWYDLAVARVSGQLSLALGVPAGFADLSLVLSGNYQDQAHTMISTDASVAERDAWLLQDAKFEGAKANVAVKLGVKPFGVTGPFGDLFETELPRSLGFSWSLDARLWSRAFESGDGIDPVYAVETFAWDRDSLNVHQASLSFAPSVGGYAQNLSVSASLPPLRQSYAGKVDLRAKGLAVSASTRWAARDDEGNFAWDPLAASAAWSPADLLRLNGNLSWNLEEDRPESARASLVAGPVTASLSARHSVGYRLELDTPPLGWQTVPDSERFRASDAGLSIAGDWSPDPVWKGRLAASLSASLAASQSLLKFTDSTLSLTLGVNFEVADRFTLSFSSVSRNQSFWRYFPGLFDFPGTIEPVNPVRDVLDSFDFFSPGQEGRYRSLWKLSSLSVKLLRELHDWDLSLELSARPVLRSDVVPRIYEFETSWTMLASWRAIPKIQTKATGKGSEFAIE